MPNVAFHSGLLSFSKSVLLIYIFLLSIYFPIGIIGCVLLLCTILTDLPLYYTTSKSLELVQRFLALSSFLALMISQMFSYNTGFARRQWKAHHVRLFKLFTFIVTVTTMNYEFRKFVKEVVTLIARQLDD